ncbi:MAG: hypothetical protein H7319_15625, partial [Spirosoma sp.]|nr:hypothetical protein [Spirosoma sp.]
SGQGQFGNPDADLYILQTVVEACKEAKQTAAAAKYDAIFQKHIASFG